jgi:hypothetical protein
MSTSWPKLTETHDRKFGRHNKLARGTVVLGAAVRGRIPWGVTVSLWHESAHAGDSHRRFRLTVADFAARSIRLDAS